MKNEKKVSRLWAPLAWIGSGSTQRWAYRVLLEIDDSGRWSRIEFDITKEQADSVGAHCVSKPLIPSVINAHSHAFQRAFAGLAERRSSAQDDFWSWRDRMYRVALSISPEQLKAVASQLYLELLRGGYTQVCEFHYVQHSPNGAAYEDSMMMAWMLLEAARDVGIGLTLLPVLYERSGFAATGLRDDQRRFATDARWVIDAERRIAEATRGTLCNAGVAIHSLRAATRDGMEALINKATGPIHIHVSEQTGEVDDCLKHTGLRPVQWLTQHHALDRRWQLVHATHVTLAEIDAVARAGATVVLCPTTEANLGDGLTDLRAWLHAGTSIAIGSDSHVTRDWREELRWLEYGQRLQLRTRNVAASPDDGVPSTAERLYSKVTASAAAAGFEAWGVVPGARADALLLDASSSALLGVPKDRLLDAAIFSSPSSAFADVLVAGQWRIKKGVHANQSAIAAAFSDAMHSIIAND